MDPVGLFGWQTAIIFVLIDIIDSSSFISHCQPNSSRRGTSFTIIPKLRAMPLIADSLAHVDKLITRLKQSHHSNKIRSAEPDVAKTLSKSAPVYS